MMYVVIRCFTGLLQANPGSLAVYDFLMEKGACHEEATKVLNWSKDAAVGDHYDLDGFEIVIV